MKPAFEMRGITKRFGKVTANNEVSLQAEKGTVLCIVGENGAGKSTLMNILYGMIKPDEGSIFLDGEKVSFTSSRDAMRHHIGMVFQHFMLIPEMSCIDNIILGMEPHRGIVLNRGEAVRRIKEIMERYHMEIPLDTPAGELWVGLQQKLEIIKTLYRGAEIIILDEPTAVLTAQETEELFVNIRKLAKMGKTVILITHKLDEVMRIADDIVVMRTGRVIKKLKPEDTDIHDLSIHMVGKEIPPMRERIPCGTEKLLELKGITKKGKSGIKQLNEINLNIRRGEILGVAGVSGNGQGELAQVVAGILRAEEGRILLAGQDITEHSRLKRIEDRISYIPEDRNKTGTCLEWSIENNCIAGYQNRYAGKGGILNRKETQKLARRLVEKFSIAAQSVDMPIKSLSGGNVQKVVVARESEFDPVLIIAAEPTRGVDIGAIHTIHNHMIDLRNQGTSVLLISSSLDEILTLSDRIAVLFEGKIMAVLNPENTTREEIGLYMSGAKEGVVS